MVRHGVMVVGTTGTGKTTNYRTLAAAMGQLNKEGSQDYYHKQVKIELLNPKSVTMNELFGYTNLMTNEWTDGIVANIVRINVQDTSDMKKWYDFFHNLQGCHLALSVFQFMHPFQIMLFLKVLLFFLDFAFPCRLCLFSSFTLILSRLCYYPIFISFYRGLFIFQIKIFFPSFPSFPSFSSFPSFPDFHFFFFLTPPLLTCSYFPTLKPYLPTATPLTAYSNKTGWCSTVQWTRCGSRT